MVKLAIPQILFRPVLTALLAVLACGSYDTLKAGSISAYREEGGKVVFVNEPEAQYPPERTAELAAPSGALPDASTRQERNRSVFLNGFDQMIQAAALRHRVDPALVRAIVQVESNFNPFAVSSRGAMGLMQLVPATARRFGVKNTFDPKANLDGGVRYLKYLMTLFGGDLRLSLAAYNAGENAVDRHSGVPPYPETQDYLRRISELYPLAAGSRRVVSSTMASTMAAAEIDKYVDDNGTVHFSNTDRP